MNKCRHQTKRYNRTGIWSSHAKVSLSVVAFVLFVLTTVQTAGADVFNIPSGDVDALIDAINEANANDEDDVINLEAGTYTLTDVNNDANPNSNGLPQITSKVLIRGTGANTTIIERDNAAPDFAFFFVTGERCQQPADCGFLELEGMTLTGGIGVSGGAIHNQGTTVLVNTNIRGNTVFSNL